MLLLSSERFQLFNTW